ncbi:leucine-rich repeat domain-containing protein [Candidatus Palauibacter sp.]|uniref:leucine-rich repeat domain-containing protein n=1 Tax=Candidatus Palauibacter sp. TaxID=3101350 RepID=UPI003D141CA5
MTYRAAAVSPVSGSPLPVLVSLALLVVVSCAEDTVGPSVPVASVTVSPASAALAPGETLRLTAEARDDQGNTVPNARFSWASSDASAATVNDRGEVTAAGGGTAMVTATERSSGLSAAAHVLVGGAPRDVLLYLYTVLGGSGWTDDRNWGTDAPLGTWHGVSTDRQDRIIGLGLSGNGLTGSIPPQLATFSALRRLDLYDNDIEGPIPPELADLQSLTALRINSNDLTGPIPRELGNLGRLRTLNLAYNDLTGPVPRELGNLANLRNLRLNGNDLTGGIPPELGDLEELTELSLSRNGLEGPIPRELGALSRLEKLWLYLNDLTGPIPAELGELSSLDLLSVSHNDLSGALPADIGRLGKLEYLNLTANGGLSGRLPAELAGLDRLTALLARGTGLCAPPDADFLVWLQRLEDAQVNPCRPLAGSVAYLTQAVQSLDFPVPLVAGDEALLRVFVVAGRATEAGLPPVRATFYLDGVETHRADIPAQTTRIPTWIAEASLEATANASIPGRVVQPGLEMVVEIDPDGTLDPDLGVTRRIPETGRTPVDVREMPVFDLTVVPFLLRNDPDRSILDLIRGLTAEADLLWPTRTLLPVGRLDLTVHQTVTTSSDDVFALLRETAAIRTMEGGSGHYLGLKPRPVSGGFLGLAIIGGRASFSIPDSTLIAHELGHNMSLRHAPCGDPLGVDAVFPNVDGVTGAWGYDFEEGTLQSSRLHDLMSYCYPQWIGDYGFTKALRHRLEDEAGAAAGGEAAEPDVAPTTSLLLWGGIDEHGTPFLEPAFVVEAPPRLPGQPGGAYEITGRTAAGAELFSIRPRMRPVADGNGASVFVVALPMRSERAERLAEIRLSGPEGVAVLDESSDQPMAILRDPANGQVRGMFRGDVRGVLPSTLAGRDAASAGPGPELDVILSRGLPAATARRR